MLTGSISKPGVTGASEGSRLRRRGGARHQRTATTTPQTIPAVLTIPASHPVLTSDETSVLNAPCHSATQRTLRPLARYTCAITKAPHASANNQPNKIGPSMYAMPGLSQNGAGAKAIRAMQRRVSPESDHASAASVRSETRATPSLRRIH